MERCTAPGMVWWVNSALDLTSMLIFPWKLEFHGRPCLFMPRSTWPLQSPVCERAYSYFFFITLTSWHIQKIQKCWRPHSQLRRVHVGRDEIPWGNRRHESPREKQLATICNWKHLRAASPRSHCCTTTLLCQNKRRYVCWNESSSLKEDISCELNNPKNNRFPLWLGI